MKKGNFYVISAPSGTGKTSLVRVVAEKNRHIEVSISYTTRPQRPGEIPGKNYHFIDRKQFEAMIIKSDFLEYAENYGHYYGTSKNGVEQQLEQGQDVILEIDWQGQAQVKQIMPQSGSIFILPPNLDVLKQRLISRAQDSDEVIQRRLQTSKTEISHAKNYDYIIINDDFDQAVGELQSIIKAKRHHFRAHRQHFDAVIADLLT